MRVLLALDKFKGTLTGDQATEVVRQVLASLLPSAELRAVALADGGDGSLAVALAHGYEPVSVAAADAQGTPSVVTVGLAGRRAFLEMAATCGLSAVPPAERDGMRATSLGLGRAAGSLLDLGVDDITIGLGGSASTDGGLGFLVGLGVEAVDAQGARCTPDVPGLERVRALVLEALHPAARDCRWTFLTDVDSPLLGPRGAARLFGPQKGLDAAQVERAESALTRWAQLVREVAGRDLSGTPGAGAAGGIITGAAVLGQPRIESGARYLARLTRLDEHLEWADLVITGEGRFDEQSLLGKGPGLVLARAGRVGVPVGVIAGGLDVDPMPAEVRVAVSLESVAGSAELAQQRSAFWLAQAVRRFVEEAESKGLLTGVAFE